MSRTMVVSARLQSSQQKRLARRARQLGRSTSETSAMLIEEGLRRNEFAFIDFRDTPAGRQAYVQGSTLAIWEVIWIANGYRGDLHKTAAHLQISPLKVQAAWSYAQAYPDEIAESIGEHEESDFTSLSRMLPQTEIFPAPKRP